MENTRNCQECGTVIKGRIDKKFCSDQCRFMYNNREKRQKDASITHVNSILRKNRTILKNLNPVGKTTIRKAKLENDGFNFDFHTHIFRANNGMVYYFCYEFGYAMASNDKVILVSYQKYMNPAIHNIFGNQNE